MKLLVIPQTGGAVAEGEAAGVEVEQTGGAEAADAGVDVKQSTRFKPRILTQWHTSQQPIPQQGSVQPTQQDTAQVQEQQRSGQRLPQAQSAAQQHSRGARLQQRFRV